MWPWQRRAFCGLASAFLGAILISGCCLATAFETGQVEPLSGMWPLICTQHWALALMHSCRWCLSAAQAGFKLTEVLLPQPFMLHTFYYRSVFSSGISRGSSWRFAGGTCSLKTVWGTIFSELAKEVIILQCSEGCEALWAPREHFLIRVSQFSFLVGPLLESFDSFCLGIRQRYSSTGLASVSALGILYPWPLLLLIRNPAWDLEMWLSL